MTSVRSDQRHEARVSKGTDEVRKEGLLPAEISEGKVEASRNGKWGPRPTGGTFRSVQA